MREGQLCRGGHDSHPVSVPPQALQASPHPRLQPCCSGAHHSGGLSPPWASRLSGRSPPTSPGSVGLGAVLSFRQEKRGVRQQLFLLRSGFGGRGPRPARLPQNRGGRHICRAEVTCFNKSCTGTGGAGGLSALGEWAAAASELPRQRWHIVPRRRPQAAGSQDPSGRREVAKEKTEDALCKRQKPAARPQTRTRRHWPAAPRPLRSQQPAPRPGPPRSWAWPALTWPLPGQACLGPGCCAQVTDTCAGHGAALGGCPVAPPLLSPLWEAAMTRSDGAALAFRCGPLLQGKGQVGAGDPDPTGAGRVLAWTSAAGSPDPNQHPLAPGILAFQLVTGSGPSPRAHSPGERPDARSFFPSRVTGPLLAMSPAPGVPPRSARASGHPDPWCQCPAHPSLALLRHRRSGWCIAVPWSKPAAPGPPALCPLPSAGWGQVPEGAVLLPGPRPRAKPCPSQARHVGAGPVHRSWGLGPSGGATHW